MRLQGQNQDPYAIPAVHRTGPLAGEPLMQFLGRFHICYITYALVLHGPGRKAQSFTYLSGAYLYYLYPASGLAWALFLSTASHILYTSVDPVDAPSPCHALVEEHASSPKLQSLGYSGIGRGPGHKIEK